MTAVDIRVSVWEAIAGRAPGQPAGPADPGVWAAVVERLNPARARPELRPGIEQVDLVSVRGVPYVMVKSPDSGGGACYLRLSQEEWRLAQLMDGSRTVARLVAEFARIAARLAPDQVTRVVADLAGNRMLAELPVDAFKRLDRVHRRPWPLRLGRGLLAAVKGQRMVLADVDPIVGFIYRAGGRLLFTRAAAVLLAVVGIAGLALFAWTWWRGEQSLFLTGGSYAIGAAVLLGLNVVALACHELGHALATKHAGRRIPAAGFLVYFGIPSVFVDTTDVWMAGRRARLVTTACGPAAGLILAGLAQIVGLVVPEAAPWTFKLAFAWYLNALFNLNPFLALDGYYLLMDWLEIPNLRARGLAFVLARLRRRPPRWGQLDQEGRLVALYGTLAVLWVVIAANLGWRIWTDRIAGLVTGVWRSGWPARLLLAAVVAGLAAPLVYLALGWLGRQLRRVRTRLAERRRELDAPRRLDALRRSALGALPGSALADLAGRARWLRPRTGEQLIFAGAALPGVLVVVDGALEARRPGDPAGTVRERLGAGGVVGLANALTGTPATLAWHTAGTTLLTIPAPAVAIAVGPLAGPPPADRAEAEALFAVAPALQALSTEERMGLVCGARLTTLPPDGEITLSGPTDVVVVEAGVVALADGTELRRGTTIGPAGEGEPGVVATARTPVRLWHLPAVAGLPLLLGSSEPRGPANGEPGGTPAAGAHPAAGYPPLAAPPGPPPTGLDPDIDRRFERKLWWLVLLFLVLALLIAGTNFVPGPAWAEMPADKALLIAERGRVEAIVDGRTVVLAAGGRIYVGEGDRIRVGDRSTGGLTFRGGSTAALCAGARASVGRLWSGGGRPVAPNGTLTLDSGRLVAYTDSSSRAFEPLALTVTTTGSTLTNQGAAWFAAGGGDVEVSTGEVRADGVRQPPTGGPLGCGDDRPAPDPTGPPSGGSIPTGVPTPSTTPTPSPSAVPSPTPTPAPARTTRRPTPRPTTAGPSTTRPAPPPPPPPPPPDRTPPTITGISAKPTSISRPQCPVDGISTVTGSVADNATPVGNIQVTASWSIPELGEGGPITVDRNGGSFQGTVVVPHTARNDPGATIVVTITAVDAAKNQSPPTTVTINLEACPPIIG